MWLLRWMLRIPLIDRLTSNDCWGKAKKSRELFATIRKTYTMLFGHIMRTEAMNIMMAWKIRSRRHRGRLREMMLDAWTNIIKITDPEQLRLRFVEKSDYLCPLSRHMMIIIYSRHLLYNIKKECLAWSQYETYLLLDNGGTQDTGTCKSGAEKSGRQDTRRKRKKKR